MSTAGRGDDTAGRGDEGEDPALREVYTVGRLPPRSGLLRPCLFCLFV